MLQQFDPALAVRRPRLLACRDDPPLLDDPAPHGPGPHEPRIVRSHRLVLLAHQPVPEERLVRPAIPGPNDAEHQARRQPVQPVRGLESGQSQGVAQPRHQGLGDVPAPWGGGEEVRLVRDHQVVVAVDDADGEGHRSLGGEVAVEPEVTPGGVRLVRAHGAPVRPDEPALCQHGVHPS